MKIGNKQMFNDYRITLDTEIEALTERIKGLEKTRDYLLGNLKAHEDHIRHYTNIDYDKIPELVRCLTVQKIRFASVGLTDEMKAAIIRIINSLIIPVNKGLEDCREDLAILKVHKVSEKLHKFVLNSFNNGISDKILGGYTFYLGHGLALVRIKKTFPKKKRIDWGSSIRVRKEIIARGGLPLKGDNGGKPWIVKLDKAIDFLWYWNKGNCNVPNKSYYRFKPTYGTNKTKKGVILGNIQKLRKLEKEDSPVLRYFMP